MFKEINFYVKHNDVAHLSTAQQCKLNVCICVDRNVALEFG